MRTKASHLLREWRVLMVVRKNVKEWELRKTKHMTTHRIFCLRKNVARAFHCRVHCFARRHCISTGDVEFKASSGWLDKFKNRHGIRELNIQAEKLSAVSIKTIDAYKEKFNSYTRDQIYNADETGLNYKALPTKTLASLSEKYAPGHKMQKQRVTVMVCANARGSYRMPLLLLGTAKRPRCFKGMNMSALPVTYRHKKRRGWIKRFLRTGSVMNLYRMCNHIWKQWIYRRKQFFSLTTRQLILRNHFRRVMTGISFVIFFRQTQHR